jgi:hypothetical protein
MIKKYQKITLKEKTTLKNLQTGAKSTLPVGVSIMARVITLPDGIVVCTAFEFIGEDRCFVLTRTLKDGKQIPNFKMKNESDEIIKDRDLGIFKFEMCVET